MDKVKKDDLYIFIKEFNNKYNLVPCTGFLAGFYKVTIQTINNNLQKLHEDKKIERLYANSGKKHYSSYKIL